MVRPLAVLIGLGAVAGCGGQTYGPCNGSNELVEAVVDTSGDVPLFDWEFGTAYALTVYEYDHHEYGRMMWHIQCGGDNLEDADSLEGQVCLETPIAYGEEPDSPFLDTVNLDPAKPLEPGRNYLVQLNTMAEDDGPTPESSLPDWLDWGSDRDDPSCGSGYSADAEFVLDDRTFDR